MAHFEIEAFETEIPLLGPITPSTSTGTSIESEPRRSHIVFIDENGVHDFDCRNRQGSQISQESSARKLRKTPRHSLASVGSVSSMSDLQRATSDGSSKSSLRKRLSSLPALSLLPGSAKHSSGNGGSGSDGFSPNSDLTVEPEDDLPHSRGELEVRLNFHLAELDQLRLGVKNANHTIQRYQERYEILQTRDVSNMSASLRKQYDLIRVARRNRNSYASFVGYHRRQLERIRMKRIELDIGDGLEPKIPEVYKTMWTDDDWAVLFQI